MNGRIMLNGSKPSTPAFICSRIVSIISACNVRTSVRPRNSRSSAGVDSIVMLIFMGCLRLLPSALRPPPPHGGSGPAIRSPVTTAYRSAKQGVRGPMRSAGRQCMWCPPLIL